MFLSVGIAEAHPILCKYKKNKRGRQEIVNENY